MSARENISRISFTVETLVVRDGQKLGRLRPDEDGYYHDFPLAVLGTPTRNRTYYDVDEFVTQITDERSYFNQMLVDGTLYGEYGHPRIAQMSHADQLNRLAVVDEDCISHHIRKVNTSDILESGGLMIRGDIKPHGPKGRYLKESLEESSTNTAMSLRSITQDRLEGDLRCRKMRKLVTFDMVAAGGYAEASKRFMPMSGATEGLSVAFSPANDIALFKEVAMESFADSELADIFGTNNVVLERRQATILAGTGLVRYDDENRLKSLYQALIRDDA